jgi:putative nucleotidyltransferase with HDIG domain
MSIRPSEPTASRLEPPVAVIGRRRQRHGWWAWLRLIFLALTLAVATSLVIALPLLPTERVVIEVGDVAQQDVRAPRRVTFESAILRAEEQERAAQRVEPVYTAPDPTPARQQLDRARRVLDYIGSVLADPLASLAQKRNWLMAVPELSDGSAPLDPETLNQLLTLPEASWNRVQLETLAVLDQAMRREIREGQLEPIAEMVPALVSLDLNDQETAVTIGLVLPFLVPNSYLDAEATAAAQAAAREQVPPVLRSFEANEIIVREGTRVTALDIEALDQLGLRKSHVVWTDVASSGLLSLTASVLLFVYVGHFQHEILWNGRQLLLLVTLTVFFTVIAGLMVPAGVVLRYLVPLPALAMLTTATLGAHAGCAVAVFGGLAAGAIAENSMEMLTYAALGSLIAALSLGRVERVRPLFRAGLFASLLHVATLGIFRLPQQPAEARALIVPMLAAIANGGISASLALGGLFLIGPLFDVITTIRLMELSRPDQPLLRRLLREAPGTYHHSLLVANLAEQAAERIGADALLTRVGAYYHDVGKIAQPAFFVENQVEGVNLHAQLEPQASAEVIIGHVRNGLEIARRYRLPRRIRAFIPEHHGTGWLRYFYSKALEASGPNGTVKESAFRYPGLRPQSKETALVMLADSCEAAVRSSRPTSDEQIAEIVNRVIDQHVADGQLDECDLTLRDLEAIRQTMIDTLRGVFHPRIEYPRLPRTERREHTIRATEQ